MHTRLFVPEQNLFLSLEAKGAEKSIDTYYENPKKREVVTAVEHSFLG